MRLLPYLRKRWRIDGTLCLIREQLQFSAEQKKLLTALVSHAALSMEKVRRFFAVGAFQEAVG